MSAATKRPTRLMSYFQIPSTNTFPLKIQCWLTRRGKKKFGPQFPEQLMNLRHFAAELCWLTSFHLCHKAGARAVLESRSAPPQHFLSLHPIPCFCPLVL